jgi:hypothetical protein
MMGLHAAPRRALRVTSVPIPAFTVNIVLTITFTLCGAVLQMAINASGNIAEMVTKGQLLVCNLVLRTQALLIARHLGHGTDDVSAGPQSLIPGLEMQQNTEWTVLGFDLRSGPLRYGSERLISNVHPLHSPTHRPSPPYPATLSTDAWPRWSGLNVDEYALNKFELFALPDFLIDTREFDDDVVVAAFCTTTGYYNSTLHLSSAPQPDAKLLFASRGWVSIGFDVVDRYAAYSAIYNFDWTSADTPDNVKIRNTKLNKFGLIDDLDTAASLLEHLDRLLPGHAYFFPCQVFVQKRGKKYGDSV